MKARFVQLVGARASFRTYVGSEHEKCSGPMSYHNAEIRIGDSPKIHDTSFAGTILDHPAERWPTKCDGCGVDMRGKGDFNRQVFYSQLYDTASGKPEPGDLYYVDWLHWDTEVTQHGDIVLPKPSKCIWGWTNCDGKHLYAILPNGHEWDIDGRCSNCTLRGDYEHRCWIRHGVPPLVTVDKNGFTCSAGAGSIQGGNYHGFLRDGVFVQ